MGFVNNEQHDRYSELPICSHLKKKLVGEYVHLMEVVEGDGELTYKPEGI